MANTDVNPKVNFNDGEALEASDLGRVQQVVDSKVLEQYTTLSGQDIANIFNMGQGAGKQGAALPFAIDNLAQFPTDVAIDPFPLSGPFSDVVQSQYLSPGVIGQAHNANMAGTRPDGSPSPVFIKLDDSAAVSFSAAITANPAPGAGDPRWDVFGIRMGYGDVGNSVVRDFKDAVTGALSTQAVNKDLLLNLNGEYQTGAQAATYNPTTAIAALTAGFVPALVVRRPAGSGTTVTAADLHYIAFPTRLGVEDIMGYEGHFSGNVAYDVAGAFAPFPSTSDPGPGAEWLGTSGAGVIDFFPRTMHAGSRLVGVAIGGVGFDHDFRFSLMRHDFDAAGARTVTRLADLDTAQSGRILTSAPGGIQYASGIGTDPDWAEPAGASLFPAPGYPIWGNGTTYGPCSRATSLGAVAFSKLALRVEEGGGTFDANDLINFVRFVYLH